MLMYLNSKMVIIWLVVFGILICLYLITYYLYQRQRVYFVSFTYKTNYGYEFGNCLFKTNLNVKDEKSLSKIEAYLFEKVKPTADVRVVVLLSIERM